jgi:hypothetical protein
MRTGEHNAAMRTQPLPNSHSPKQGAATGVTLNSNRATQYSLKSAPKEYQTKKIVKESRNISSAGL